MFELNPYFELFKIYLDDKQSDSIEKANADAQKKIEEHPDIPAEEYERFVKPFNSRETFEKIRKTNQS